MWRKGQLQCPAHPQNNDTRTLHPVPIKSVYLIWSILCYREVIEPEEAPHKGTWSVESSSPDESSRSSVESCGYPASCLLVMSVLKQAGGGVCGELCVVGRHESNIKEAQVLCTAKWSELISLRGCKNNVTPLLTPIRPNVTLVFLKRCPGAKWALREDKQPTNQHLPTSNNHLWKKSINQSLN